MDKLDDAYEKAKNKRLVRRRRAVCVDEGFCPVCAKETIEIMESGYKTNYKKGHTCTNCSETFIEE